MKVLFKNTTKYDKENCNNFIDFHNRKYGTRELIKAISIILVTLYLIIFNIIHKNYYLILGIILVGILVYFLNKKKQEKERKKRKKIKEYTFYFYERYIKIRYRRQFERMSYFEIKKVFETKENFFLYVDEDKSLILDKDGFEVGTKKEFSEFIKRKCPFRYNKESSK